MQFKFYIYNLLYGYKNLFDLVIKMITSAHKLHIFAHFGPPFQVKKPDVSNMI